MPGSHNNRTDDFTAHRAQLGEQKEVRDEKLGEAYPGGVHRFDRRCWSPQESSASANHSAGHSHGLRNRVQRRLRGLLLAVAAARPGLRGSVDLGGDRQLPGPGAYRPDERLHPRGADATLRLLQHGQHQDPHPGHAGLDRAVLQRVLT